MKKQGIKLLGILLATILLSSNVYASAEPPADRITGLGLPIGVSPAATPENLETDTWAQAFSVGMMCWNSYTDRIHLWEPYFAWEATGWYAALLHRVEGIDILPQNTVEDYQRSIGVEEPIGDPNAWLGDGQTPQDYLSFVRRDAEQIIREDLVLTMAQGFHDAVTDLEKMGLVIQKNPDGSYAQPILRAFIRGKQRHSRCVPISDYRPEHPRRCAGTGPGTDF